MASTIKINSLALYKRESFIGIESYLVMCVELVSRSSYRFTNQVPCRVLTIKQSTALVAFYNKVLQIKIFFCVFSLLLPFVLAD